MKKLSLERFEDRINMSGFGPEDGAMIVEPWTGSYDEVRIDSSGRILAAGEDDTAGAAAIARYSASGDVDAGYGVGGRSTPALGSGIESAKGLVLQADGKAVISYNRTNGVSSLQLGVARVNADGSLDSSFGSGGWNIVDVRTTDTIPYGGAVGLQANGKIVLAGSSTTLIPSSSPWGIAARFNSNGALDSGKNAFGDVSQGKALGYTKLVSTAPSGMGGFTDSVVQPDDKIVVVGRTTPTDGTNGSFTVARYTANGKLDTSFSGDGIGYYTPPGSVRASAGGVARQADGKFVVTGSFSLTVSNSTSDLFVARVDANGTLDTSFGSGGFVTWDIDGAATATNEGGADVAIAADGKIIVTGSASSRDGAAEPASLVVLRFDSSGSFDTAFGDSGVKMVTVPAGQMLTGSSVALESDGDIIVAGTSSNYDGANWTSNPYLARFFDDSGSLMAASSAAAADEVFSSPDASTFSPYLSAWMNEPSETVSPWGKRKR